MYFLLVQGKLGLLKLTNAINNNCIGLLVLSPVSATRTVYTYDVVTCSTHDISRHTVVFADGLVREQALAAHHPVALDEYGHLLHAAQELHRIALPSQQPRQLTKRHDLHCNHITVYIIHNVRMWFKFYTTLKLFKITSVFCRNGTLEFYTFYVLSNKIYMNFTKKCLSISIVLFWPFKVIIARWLP